MLRAPFAAVCLIAAATFLPSLAEAQRPESRTERGRSDAGDRYFHDERRGQGVWEKLGDLRVSPRIEREIIRVNPRDGRFGRVGIKAFDSDIEVVELTLRYGNNEVERIAVNQVVKAGTSLPPVDMRGGERRLREVEVAYRPRGPARIEIFGEEYRRFRPGSRWSDLGCQRVGFMDGSDVIQVGLEGGARQIKFTVEGNSVRMSKIRVVFGNGTSQTIDVRTVIPDGTESRPIDLDGRVRGISRIELYYLPQMNFAGRATVCAYGMQ